MAPRMIDEKDAAILNILQEGIDLVERPFQAIGERAGLTEEEVMARIAELKNGTIRQISAIFDTRTLGYSSSLVAARIAPERLDEAAAIINRHPGVTHNYKRNHSFNLWFTLAVPPNSRLGLEETTRILGEQAGVEAIRMLPTLKLFKIGVNLDMSGKQDLTKTKAAPQYREEDRSQASRVVTEQDIRMIRELQKDLPIVPRPFDQWAANAGVTVQELLEGARAFVEKKQMRRYSAVLNHRKAGYTANGMGVWVVPPERTDEVGYRMAEFKAVSHCYLRPVYEDWPYNIFTMVHGRSVDECESILQAIEDETGIRERITLYSTKEYKKTRVSYFTPEMDAWEDEVIRHGGAGTAAAEGEMGYATGKN
ncbi:AsnC family transcriptional regulator [Paenibacillus sp. YN15]|uniref:siroheme decarboxylase subunit alpha n=1 Tax=Paenibacillus sp. YN15 TaxID=1742774 RepID=UPI000DCB0B83|nr:AsnC family transcriptional regulator [Paenibacillus sp. YN15]RAV06353.1 Lrp/AsnC family transcriptional regulator [Paenibacillus sp. YN15]